MPLAKKYGVTHVRITVSRMKNKKYLATFNYGGERCKVNFGDRRYQQYHDRTSIGKYTNMDHWDSSRRQQFYARHHRNINNPLSGSFWSARYLW